MTDTENVIKLVVIGDLGVGKTSIIRRYVESDYSPEYRISVQLDFKQKQVALGQRKLNLQLWDVRMIKMTLTLLKYFTFPPKIFRFPAMRDLEG